jgi:hypothetical protein
VPILVVQMEPKWVVSTKAGLAAKKNKKNADLFNFTKIQMNN